jgi:glycosyltransferase involved in cell wall biosynthesis
MPRNVLIIAYYFPPLAGAGVQRPLKFARYLPKFGWNPYVVTVSEDCTYPYEDLSLLKEVEGGAFIERATDPWDWLAAVIARFPGVARIVSWLKHGDVSNLGYKIRERILRIPFFDIPDGQISWLLPAYRRALSIIKRYPIDAIYTTSAPFTSHLVGYWLKRKTGLPWLADFRDEWTQNPNISYPTKLHKWLNFKLENEVLTQADHVISVSKPITQLLSDSSVDPSKFSTITNGFDREEIEEARRTSAGRTLDGVFRIAFAGNFYAVPHPLFQAVEALLENGAIPAEKLRLKLIGRIFPIKMTRPEWQQILELPGYLEHRKVLDEILNSDCSLLIISSQRGDRAYSGKIFEYIALGKPVLALVPSKGVAADLIRESHTGVVVPLEDTQAIQSALLELFQKWETGYLEIQPAHEVIMRYERSHLTGELAEILDRLVENHA